MATTLTYKNHHNRDFGKREICVGQIQHVRSKPWYVSQQIVIFSTLCHILLDPNNWVCSHWGCIRKTIILGHPMLFRTDAKQIVCFFWSYCLTLGISMIEFSIIKVTFEIETHYLTLCDIKTNDNRNWTQQVTHIKQIPCTSEQNLCQVLLLQM